MDGLDRTMYGTPSQNETMMDEFELTFDKMVNKIMPSPFKVKVVPPAKSFGIFSGPVYYEVKVSTMTDSWTVRRRYTEFEELKTELWWKNLGRNVELPAKHPAPGDDRAMLAKRAYGLQRWSAAVLQDERACKLGPCVKFFGLHRAPETVTKRTKAFWFIVLMIAYFTCANPSGAPSVMSSSRFMQSKSANQAWSANNDVYTTSAMRKVRQPGLGPALPSMVTKGFGPRASSTTAARYNGARKPNRAKQLAVAAGTWLGISLLRAAIVPPPVDAAISPIAVAGVAAGAFRLRGLFSGAGIARNAGSLGKFF